jgi:hypothetical protein
VEGGTPYDPQVKKLLSKHPNPKPSTLNLSLEMAALEQSGAVSEEEGGRMR